ncbi:3-hydroxyacyl-ACP dehydratase FabZ family protein [Streptomyces cupreus]|uniref:ApeI dehydratase-like domain-containing protein n=1 Tax=Streptomyces cupreus TaxID=2759956 RepID=A0A7X1J407_9ACTN|nr:hypothetical protein [Streptomyces cupreus]MBC2903691.1 hypothetical protein [Streptomyces cupreus]
MRATAFGRAVPVVGRDGETLTARTRVEADETVLAGHYPGFPVLPAVCLVEAVDLALDGAGRWERGRMRLAEIESSRFLGPVLPGDDLTLTMTVEPSHAGDAVRCTATVSAGRGPAARLRLLYRAVQP